MCQRNRDINVHGERLHTSIQASRDLERQENGETQRVGERIARRRLFYRISVSMSCHTHTSVTSQGAATPSGGKRLRAVAQLAAVRALKPYAL